MIKSRQFQALPIPSQQLTPMYTIHFFGGGFIDITLVLRLMPCHV